MINLAIAAMMFNMHGEYLRGIRLNNTVHAVKSHNARGKMQVKLYCASTRG